MSLFGPMQVCCAHVREVRKKGRAFRIFWGHTRRGEIETYLRNLSPRSGGRATAPRTGPVSTASVQPGAAARLGRVERRKRKATPSLATNAPSMRARRSSLRILPVRFTHERAKAPDGAALRLWRLSSVGWGLCQDLGDSGAHFRREAPDCRRRAERGNGCPLRGAPRLAQLSRSRSRRKKSERELRAVPNLSDRHKLDTSVEHGFAGQSGRVCFSHRRELQ